MEKKYTDLRGKVNLYVTVDKVLKEKMDLLKYKSSGRVSINQIVEAALKHYFSKDKPNELQS